MLSNTHTQYISTVIQHIPSTYLGLGGVRDRVRGSARVSDRVRGSVRVRDRVRGGEG